MTAKQGALEAFRDWYSKLPVHSASGGPAKGSIAAALVVLEQLKANYSLDLETYRAKGGSQIKGASGAAVARILARHGETRPFAREGGRTNRGGPGDIRAMLEALKKADLEKLSANDRNEIIDELQVCLVEKVVEFHNRERLRVVYDPSRTPRHSVSDLLALAKETGKEGPVAQHLVGAKLQLRFPDIPISNLSYSTADYQLGRSGDFQVGDTAFHVTVAPGPAVYTKCKENLQSGVRAFLLAPERSLATARLIAEDMVPGRVWVESIESFVGQNVAELSMFSSNRLTDVFRHLLETYNQRVDEVETDKSMLVEIPYNLRR